MIYRHCETVDTNTNFERDTSFVLVISVEVLSYFCIFFLYLPSKLQILCYTAKICIKHYTPPVLKKKKKKVEKNDVTDSEAT